MGAAAHRESHLPARREPLAHHHLPRAEHRMCSTCHHCHSHVRSLTCMNSLNPYSSPIIIPTSQTGNGGLEKSIAQGHSH